MYAEVWLIEGEGEVHVFDVTYSGRAALTVLFNNPATKTLISLPLLFSFL